MSQPAPSGMGPYPWLSVIATGSLRDVDWGMCGPWRAWHGSVAPSMWGAFGTRAFWEGACALEPSRKVCGVWRSPVGVRP